MWLPRAASPPCGAAARRRGLLAAAAAAAAVRAPTRAPRQHATPDGAPTRRGACASLQVAHFHATKQEDIDNFVNLVSSDRIQNALGAYIASLKK